MTHRAALPDLDRLNPEALKALIVTQHEQLLQKDEELLSKDEQVASRDEEIDRLKLLIAKLRRMKFGCKSEKLDRQIEQLELRLDELETSRAQQLAASPTPLAASDVNRSAKHARKPLPAHLPRETHKVLPKQEACPDCGGKLKPFGEDVSEMLEWVPEHFKVIRQIRPKLSCAGCDKIVQADAASRPIVRGMAGPGLLAHVLISKYADHLPLYRQSEIYARDGVELDRSTMAEWVGGCSRLLEPLVEALRRHVMSAGKLHADDTPVPVLAPGKGKTKTGRLWTYVRDDRPWGDQSPPAVWFAYTPDRKGEHVRGAQVCGSERSAGADRGPVCHRGRDPGPFRRRATRDSERAQPAVARIAETMVRRDFGQAIEKIRDHESHSLRTGAVGGGDALLRRWSPGNRQQCGGTLVARSCFGKKKLPISWIGRRGRTRSGDLWPDRNSKTQRAQP